MNNLPHEILHIISGYYGEKKSKDLSDEIRDHKLLSIIKKNNYYNEKTKTWHIGTVLQKLKSEPYFTADKSQTMLTLFNKEKKNIWWSQWDNQVTKLWFLYSTEERRQIFTDVFHYTIDEN